MAIVAAGIAGITGIVSLHAWAAEPGPPTRITPVISSASKPPKLAQAQEVLVFKEAACHGKANGLYCGSGENHQIRFQCTGGEIAFTHSCPGGCRELTLQCRQRVDARLQ